MTLPQRMLDRISKLPESEQAIIKENYQKMLSKIPFSIEISNENIGYILYSTSNWVRENKSLFCSELTAYNHYNPFLILLAKNNPASIFEHRDLIEELDNFYFDRVNDFFKTISNNNDKYFMIKELRGLREDFSNKLLGSYFCDISSLEVKSFFQKFINFTGIFKDCGIYKAIKPIMFLELKEPIDFIILPKTEALIPFRDNNGVSYLSRSRFLNEKDTLSLCNFISELQAKEKSTKNVLAQNNKKQAENQNTPKATTKQTIISEISLKEEKQSDDISDDIYRPPTKLSDSFIAFEKYNTESFNKFKFYFKELYSKNKPMAINSLINYTKAAGWSDKERYNLLGISRSQFYNIKNESNPRTRNQKRR
jgi:hypothetical protein